MFEINLVTQNDRNDDEQLLSMSNFEDEEAQDSSANNHEEEQDSSANNHHDNNLGNNQVADQRSNLENR